MRPTATRSSKRSPTARRWPPRPIRTRRSRGRTPNDIAHYPFDPDEGQGDARRRRMEGRTRRHPREERQSAGVQLARRPRAPTVRRSRRWCSGSGATSACRPTSRTCRPGSSSTTPRPASCRAATTTSRSSSWVAAADPDDSAIYSGDNFAPHGQNAMFWSNPKVDGGRRAPRSRRWIRTSARSEYIDRPAADRARRADDRPVLLERAVRLQHRPQRLRPFARDLGILESMGVLDLMRSHSFVSHPNVLRDCSRTCSRCSTTSTAGAGDRRRRANSWTHRTCSECADAGDVNTLNPHLGQFADVGYIGADDDGVAGQVGRAQQALSRTGHGRSDASQRRRQQRRLDDHVSPSQGREVVGRRAVRCRRRRVLDEGRLEPGEQRSRPAAAGIRSRRSTSPTNIRSSTI